MRFPLRRGVSRCAKRRYGVAKGNGAGKRQTRAHRDGPSTFLTLACIALLAKGVHRASTPLWPRWLARPSLNEYSEAHAILGKGLAPAKASGFACGKGQAVWSL